MSRIEYETKGVMQDLHNIMCGIANGEICGLFIVAIGCDGKVCDELATNHPGMAVQLFEAVKATSDTFQKGVQS